MLKRKIDNVLHEWKVREGKKPLIVRGARQIGKTLSIRQFGKENYGYMVEINFALQPRFKAIFEDGFEVELILKNISLLAPNTLLVPHKTLIFFDELHECPSCATALKSFQLDGRYDVICSVR